MRSAVPLGLPFEDLIRVPSLARIDKERALLQLSQRLGAAWDRLDLHGFVAVEANVIDPAVCRSVLILAADRLLQDVDLDSTCLFGQGAGLTIR